MVYSPMYAMASTSAGSAMWCAWSSSLANPAALLPESSNPPVGNSPRPEANNPRNTMLSHASGIE